MPEYQWALGNGEIITADYNRSNDSLSGEQVRTELLAAFQQFGHAVDCEPVSDGLSEVYNISFADKDYENIIICAKGTTPGGRSNLNDEQRTQQKSKYINYAYQKKQDGHNAIQLGIYRRDGQTIFCAWKLKESTAGADTPISKQIKISTIAHAMKEGFVQQDKGSGEFACAFRKEFIYFYIRNAEWLHGTVVTELSNNDTVFPDGDRQIEFTTDYKNILSHNRILFGAPGTGKSFTLNSEAKALMKDGGYEERVTFHPDYSYANFVGTYKPVMVGVSESDNGLDKDVISVLSDKTKSAQEKYDLLYDKFNAASSLTRLPVLLGLYTDNAFETKKSDGTNTADNNSAERNHGKALRPYVTLPSDVPSKEEIAYEYVPGPFMRVLAKALKNAMTGNPKPHLLIIEEINRANVAAVFGDVFQLLDRASNNASEYEIATTNEMRSYLTKELGISKSAVETIRIPDNMFLWATMNSADQGVFPMDTAFKRRWDFTYLGINDSEKDLIGKTVVLGSGNTKQKVEWNKLRRAINNFLAKEKINEDKQLGPYFIARNIVVPEEGTEIDNDRFVHTFKSKVIMYLFEDAAKQKRPKLFEGCFENSSRYSEICREFDEKGIGIFHHDIQLEAEPEDLDGATPTSNE